MIAKGKPNLKKIDLVRWKLRFPLFIFIVGFISGIYQYFPAVSVFENDWLGSLQFLGTIAIIVLILEKTRMNDRKAHFIVGLMIIAAGYFADTLMYARF
ncbi:MAG TPA: hypothetical protein VFK33_07615 [Bacillales bacterium]|nr:hypothetical protein [Bacillales bacterium]